MSHHTAECVANTERVKQQQAAWRSRWPNYCRACEGNGAFHNPGVWRYPDGTGEPPSDDPCEDCTCEGTCARCGKDGLNKDTGEGPCFHCGWNYDDALPEYDYCGCEMPE